MAPKLYLKYYWLNGPWTNFRVILSEISNISMKTIAIGKVSCKMSAILLRNWGPLHYCMRRLIVRSWWRHQIETLSAFLAICARNSPVTGKFPAQRAVTPNFDVFFDLRPNKRLSKQSWGWWFERLSRPLWRHCNISRSRELGVSSILVALDLHSRFGSNPTEPSANFQSHMNILTPILLGARLRAILR